MSVLAVDLGKTSSRVALVADGQVLRTVRAAGTPGLAHPGGLAAALAVTVRLARELTSAVRLVGIGSAGSRVGASAAVQLADGVRAALGAEQVMVTNDVVTAHVGALGGAPGVVTIAGTGAVALAVGHVGPEGRGDGRGVDLAGEGPYGVQRAEAAHRRVGQDSRRAAAIGRPEHGAQPLGAHPGAAALVAEPPAGTVHNGR